MHNLSKHYGTKDCSTTSEALRSSNFKVVNEKADNSKDRKGALPVHLEVSTNENNEHTRSSGILSKHTHVPFGTIALFRIVTNAYISGGILKVYDLERNRCKYLSTSDGVKVPSPMLDDPSVLE